MTKRDKTKRVILEQPRPFLHDNLTKYADDMNTFAELMKQFPIYDSDGKPLDNEDGIQNTVEIIKRMGITVATEDYPDGVPQEKLYDVVSANLKEPKRTRL